ncbi:MAG: phosphotransferase [Candidatus Latescibacteria bacterium]|nr:phosphotransferase [Candidatus Latescibacterota bacterium]
MNTEDLNAGFNDLDWNRQYSLCIQAAGMLQPHYRLGLRGLYLIGDIMAGDQGEAGYMKFRYTTSEGEFILGIHYWLAEPNVAQLESYLLWLDALAHDTDLRIQTSVANRQGQIVTPLQVWDSRTACFRCFSTLQRWLPGAPLWPHAGFGYRSPDAPLPQRSNAQLAAMGRTLATIHRHSSTWPRPDDFKRPPVAREQASAVVEQYRDRLDATAHLQCMLQTAQDVDAHIADFSAGSPDKGLCHGDPNPANFVIDSDVVSPIDFDACGEGLYLADIAVSLQAMDPQRRRSVLEGYAEVSALPPETEPVLEALIMQWTLSQLQSPWWTSSPLSPFRDDWAGLGDFIAAQCQRFATGRPWLYEPSPLVWFKDRLGL